MHIKVPNGPLAFKKKKMSLQIKGDRRCEVGSHYEMEKGKKKKKKRKEKGG